MLTFLWSTPLSVAISTLFNHDHDHHQVLFFIQHLCAANCYPTFCEFLQKKNYIIMIICIMINLPDDDGVRKSKWEVLL